MTFHDGQLIVGIGICTYNRPDFLRRAVESVDSMIGNKLSVKVIYDDGSTDWDEELYQTLSEEKGWMVLRNEENNGVAYAKNQLLSQLMASGCEMLVLMEDDIEVISPSVIDAYATVIAQTGIQHLNFAHHGPKNIGRLLESDGYIEVWGNLMGAWSVYTRECLEVTGNFDTEFGNKLDHVHHTYMCALNGFTTPWLSFADVRGSDRMLRDQPHAIESSTIGEHESINEPAFQHSLRHWARNYPIPNNLLWLLR